MDLGFLGREVDWSRIWTGVATSKSVYRVDLFESWSVLEQLESLIVPGRAFKLLFPRLVKTQILDLP